MRTAGIVVLVISICLVLGTFNMVLTQYNLRSVHDVSKLCGGLGFVSLLAAIGVVLIRRARKKTDEAEPQLAPPRDDSAQDSQEGKGE